MMHAYRIKIVMVDGSVGIFHAIFANDWEAILTVLGDFGDAASVTPRRIRGAA